MRRARAQRRSRRSRCSDAVAGAQHPRRRKYRLDHRLAQESRCLRCDDRGERDHCRGRRSPGCGGTSRGDEDSLAHRGEKGQSSRLNRHRLAQCCGATVSAGAMRACIAFTRDGFVLKRDYLGSDEFARLKRAVLALEAPAREMVQGDTITRRIALDGDALTRLPMVRALFNRSDWRGLMRYVGSFDQEPLYYIQTILSHVKDAAPDPQTNLHADTFHPSIKAWLFLTDVVPDEGPF